MLSAEVLTSIPAGGPTRKGGEDLGLGARSSAFGARESAHGGSYDAGMASTIGEDAPDFTLPGSDGRTYHLADLRGRPVVIAWYPKAFTPG